MEEDLKKYKLISPVFVGENREIKITSCAVNITAGYAFQLPVMAPKPNSTIKWTFTLKDYDCLFGVASQKDQYRGDYILKNELYQPNVSVSGSITVKSPGTYYLVWDNSYSWFIPKTVVYSLSILLPPDGIEDKNKSSRLLYKDLEECKAKLQNYKETTSSNKAKQVELKKAIDQKKELLLSCTRDDNAVDEKVGKCKQEKNEIEVKKKHYVDEFANTKRNGAFIVETERILNMLDCDDLLRLACVNSFFHRNVHQDLIWEFSFIHCDRKRIVALMHNKWLERTWYRINPTTHLTGFASHRHSVYVKEVDNLVLQPAGEKPLPPDELAKKIMKEHTIAFQDLSVVYRVSEKQGWYSTSDNYCYYVLTNDFKKPDFQIVYARIHVSQLSFLVHQVVSSPVLLPLPGTIAGEEGFYMGRSCRVARYSVKNGQWTKVPF